MKCIKCKHIEKIEQSKLLSRKTKSQSLSSCLSESDEYLDSKEILNNTSFDRDEKEQNDDINTIILNDAEKMSKINEELVINKQKEACDCSQEFKHCGCMKYQNALLSKLNELDGNINKLLNVLISYKEKQTSKSVIDIASNTYNNDK